jgi:hypothetical protein
MRRTTAHAGSWVALALLCGGLVSGSAQASTPRLFHSPGDTGNDPGTLVPPLGPNATRVLNLWLDPGNVFSPCGPSTCGSTANGDVTCGVHFEIEVGEDLTILPLPNSLTLESQFDQTSARIDGKKLRVAIVTTADPICAAPTRLGSLAILSGPVGGTVTLSKLETVDASLDLQTGGARDIAFIPEPSLALQLAAGVSALTLLSRQRSKRSGGLR